MKRRYLLLTLLLTGCGANGFTPRKIASTHRPDPRFDTPLPCAAKVEEIQGILNQPFAYVDKGNHCYAFESQDKQYILKFFRQTHLGRHKWQNFLPFPSSWMPKYQAWHKKHLEKRAGDFTGYKLAYEKFKKGSGLLYVQLNPKKLFNKRVHLVYKDKRADDIAIDKMEFLLQKKAEIGFSPIKEKLERGETKEALALVESYFKLIKARCQTGLSDSDLQFHKNFGFVGEDAIEVDLGYLREEESMKDPQSLMQEISQVSIEIENWFNDNYREHLPKVQEIRDHVANDSRRQFWRTKKS